MKAVEQIRTNRGWLPGCGWVVCLLAAGCGTSQMAPLPLGDLGDQTDNQGGLTDNEGGQTDDLDDLVFDEAMEELPGLILDETGISLDGVLLAGNPEESGELLTVSPVGDGEDLAAPAAAERSAVQATGMGVTANPVNANSSVTFTATVSGGTGLYYFFWWLEGDGKWTQGGRSHTRTLTRTPRQSIYFIAMDTNRVQSSLRSWYVTVNAAAATKITGAISASKSSNIRPGESVTFTAVNVQGGVPPYTYFWMMDHDSSWTTGGTSFTRQIDDSATKRTAYLCIYDSAGRYSDFIPTEVTLDTSNPPVDRVCPTIAGTWSLSDHGWSTESVLTIQVNGSTVTGNYDGRCGEIRGQIVASGSDCPDCIVVQGTWDDTAGNSASSLPICNVPQFPYARGEIRMTFRPDLSGFDARYSYEGQSHWQASLWSGSRIRCGDGSEPRR